MRFRILLLILVFLLAPYSVNAKGNKTINSCGQFLDKPGNYRLVNDLESCPDFGIVVVSSNVSINLSGHTISCNPADGVPTEGIVVFQSSNVRIRNGEIMNCDIGVDLLQSHDSQVVNMTVTGSADTVFGGVGIYGFEATGNRVIGNVTNGNNYGIGFFFSSNNQIIGNVANGNFRRVTPLPTYGIGIAITFSNDNDVIGNQVNNNTDAGIAIANGSSGNIIRDNVALDNDNYGIGMFSREDFGTPLAFDNLNQSNTALGNGRADIMEAKFDPYAVPREIVQPDCVNAWKDNTFETLIAPPSCVE